MRRVLLTLVLVGTTGCFAPVPEFDGGSGGGGVAGGTGGGSAGGGGGGTAGGSGGGAACVNTSECGSGQVCNGCPGASHCERGCESSAQCPADQHCGQANNCFTCPCPPAQCEPNNPCTDDDQDGYVAGFTACSSKPGGDCDDHDASVHPGAVENCSNGRDDNCDGLVDKADRSCSLTCGSSNTCTSSFTCVVGTTFCSGTSSPACCQSCPLIAVKCAPGYASRPAGVDPATGCPQVGCFPDTVCPSVYAPVCSTNGSTYGNPCEAGAAGAVIAHGGECTPGEGLRCDFLTGGPDRCGTSGTLYCRDACPECDSLQGQCMKVGVCLQDYDCPAGLAPPPLALCQDGGTPRPHCVSSACQWSCN